MYRRLIILSVIIGAALCGLTLLGYHAVEKWAEGLEWARLGEFAEVAEQIRQDVERKLDEFVQAEEERPYMHYQDYYVPDNFPGGQQQMPVLVSPLSGRRGIENYLANDYFQVEPDGSIVTANDDILQREGASISNNVIYAQTQLNRFNVKNNLVPVLRRALLNSLDVQTDKKAPALLSPVTKAQVLEEAKLVKNEVEKKKDVKSTTVQRRRGAGENYYRIETLQRRDRASQVIEQQRAVYMTNISGNTASGRAGGIFFEGMEQGVRTGLEEGAEARQTAEERPDARREILRTPQEREAGQLQSLSEPVVTSEASTGVVAEATQAVQEPDQPQVGQLRAAQADRIAQMRDLRQLSVAANQDETVRGEKGPFMTYVVGGGNAEESIFGKQVFLVRDVQIEDRHFQQGFQLNEKRLLDEIKESAGRFVREGMSFELSQTEAEDAAYAATLDFAFGNLVLNLKEVVAERVVKQASQLRHWYFSIIVIVLLAVTLGLVSLWRYARAQIKLAEKKDDFISAVSHELRTPLTSIRMYSEMLERDWVKSKDKLAEYYKSMRQESERLSRLIENVLDFSRIQKGRKKYKFSVGDLNECVAGVVEMMTPYAAQYGFSIRTQLEQLGQTAFDNDAVKQIVVNLLDNAIKYARNAADKTITVRTKNGSQFILIEVEDHGPGVPHRQRKKIFEEFYRLGSEATRETRGTGLGLALVKRFAQAHNGFVEILAAKPAGAIFRVALAMQP